MSKAKLIGMFMVTFTIQVIITVLLYTQKVDPNSLNWWGSVIGGGLFFSVGLQLVLGVGEK